MTNPIFTTRRDAKPHLNGFEGWDFGDSAANFEDLCDYVYDHQDLVEFNDSGRPDFRAAVAAYLTSVGENPADYGL